jgi:uncharacterized protein YggT (Ycf19 family)
MIGRLFIHPLFGGPMMVVFNLIYNVLGVMTLCVLIAAIVSWLRYSGVYTSRSNTVIQWIEKVSDFTCAPIRTVVRPARWGASLIDFSPLVTLVVLQVLQMGLLKLALGLMR